MNAEPEFLIGGRRYCLDAPGFATAVAAAHAARERPLCMCTGRGIEMYIARSPGSADAFIVKRMPESGSRHAPDCPCYEPPAELSGLGQVPGTAIKEDPATGETTLKLDFALTRMPGRSRQPVPGEGDESARSDEARLSLRGLLHYLWDQAELTKWHPAFSGKRSWATVRKHLLQAAEGKRVRDRPLLEKLYVPESFSVEQRASIEERRLTHWRHACVGHGGLRELFLLVGEIKELGPGRYGHRVVVKHLPDVSFALEEALYRRMARRFEGSLSLWAASRRLHMLIIASTRLNGAEMPAVEELSLMAVTEQWLPVESATELELIERLVSEQRVFAKCLRYNAARSASLACAVLIDADDQGVGLFIEAESSTQADGASTAPACLLAEAGRWTWRPRRSAMPPFPRMRPHLHHLHHLGQ